MTVKNINETVIADGTWSAAQICTAPYKAACAAAGYQVTTTPSAGRGSAPRPAAG